MKTASRRKVTTQTDETPAHNREDYWPDALRLSELRYRRLFETAQDGILILDADSGEITDVNPFLSDLLDYPFDELRGRKLWEIGQFKDIAANRAAFETLQENEYIRYENLPLRRRDGERIHVEFVSNVTGSKSTRSFSATSVTSPPARKSRLIPRSDWRRSSWRIG